MKTDRVKIISIVIVIAVVIVIYLATRPKMISVGVVEPGTPPVATPGQKQFCYYNKISDPQNKGDTITQFISVNYSDTDTATGVSNYIPSGRDSVVGDYTASVHKNGDATYPSTIDALYTAMGDGVTVTQQEVYIAGPTGLKEGKGERYEDDNHVYQFRDVSKLLFTDPVIPAVACGSVPKNVSTDYITTKQ